MDFVYVMHDKCHLRSQSDTLWFILAILFFEYDKGQCFC